MFTKTILATATAAFIAAGTMAASTTAADAHYRGHGYHKARGHYIVKLIKVPVTKCKPIFRKIVWYDYDGYAHYKVKKVDERCYTVYVTKRKKVWVPYVTYKTYDYKPHHGYRVRFGY